MRLLQLNGKESACQYRRCGFNPWVRREDSLEKEVATHPSVLAWEPHGQRSLAGYSPRGRKGVGHNSATK